MKVILIPIILLLCSCSHVTMDREMYYSLEDYSRDGFDWSSDYKLRLKTRSVYFERKDKMRKYGYKLKNSTFFVEMRFPF